MKRAALYARVSTLDQHPENQLLELQELAKQRGFEIAGVYTDQISGAKARRPGLDELMADAHRGKFEVLAVWRCDRLARSVTHFLHLLDELTRLKIEFVSMRENLDTGGALGRAVVIIIAAIAELERNLITERVRLGMKRAKLEGRQIGRRRIAVDRGQLLRDREQGRSLTQIAQDHQISRALVSRILKEEKAAGHKGIPTAPPQTAETARSKSAA